MKNFNKKFQEIIAEMDTSTSFGGEQSHPPTIGKSGDFYAAGDARNLFGAVTKGKRKKAKKFPMIRRNLKNTL